MLTKPEIAINEGAHLNVPYGNSVSVTCTVTANPKPSINWKDSVGDVFSSGRIVSNQLLYLVTLFSLEAKYTVLAFSNLKLNV